MLQKSHVLNSVEIGLDYSVRRLKEAMMKLRFGVLQGDSRALPFKNEALGSVFCNGVLLP